MNAYYLRKNQEPLSNQEKDTLVSIAKKHNLDYSKSVSLDGFAEACYVQNTIDELDEALDFGSDIIDCNTWNIDESQWTQAIKNALVSLIRTGLNLE